jgi:hypothetical protein
LTGGAELTGGISVHSPAPGAQDSAVPGHEGCPGLAGPCRHADDPAFTRHLAGPTCAAVATVVLFPLAGAHPEAFGP